MRRVLLVEVVLEVRARAPVMLLGHQMRRDAAVDIRRGRQEQAVRVVFANGAGERFAGDGVVAVFGGRDTVPRVGCVNLVVARPEDDARVVAQAANDDGRFLIHQLQEVRRLRIQRAGHAEIVPDHDAIFVAQVEQAVILIHVASPQAHDVAAGFRKQFYGTIVALRVPAVERVHRHPV